VNGRKARPTLAAGVGTMGPALASGAPGTSRWQWHHEEATGGTWPPGVDDGVVCRGVDSSGELDDSEASR
jgi:hypothetical protein